MIIKSIEDIVKSKLRDGETLLWAGQSSLSAMHWKTLIFLLVFASLFYVPFLILFVLEPNPYFSFMTSLSGFTIAVALVSWPFWRDFFKNKARVNIAYAATTQNILVVVLKENKDIRSFARISYDDIKHVHRMRIAGAESITLVFKENLIPQMYKVIIDGLQRNTPFYNIVKQKIT